MKHIFKHFRSDLSAGIVVFFVALPLCLGIALASGAPLFAGIIAGIVGGIVIGMASQSALGVSGPAAGLAVIVLNAIQQLGSWEVFLVAVFLAGILQVIMGYAKLGIIAYYFPSSVIKGMLTGIGLIIILKQIPHALGYDKDYEGDQSFRQFNEENTFSAIRNAIIETFELITPGALLITVVSMAILILWEMVLVKKHAVFRIIQAPLVVIVAGILFSYLFRNGIIDLELGQDKLVQLPVTNSLSEFIGQFNLPDFSALGNYQVYVAAVTIALVASLETLLCVEATDKLDPERRITPTNRELKAQGLGNMISGLVGGLPLTQVIVRSTANISFGAKSKLSTIIHGILLLVCAFSMPTLLNMIPLASLACILIIVGYKLTKPSLFSEMYKLGASQFIPFIATVAGVVLTDLLKGIGIGMVFAIFYILRNNYKNPFYLIENKHKDGKAMEYNVVLSEEVSFLNKASFLQMLHHVPENATVTIDGSKSKVIDYDIIDIVNNFKPHAQSKNIELQVVGINKDKIA